MFLFVPILFLSISICFIYTVWHFISPVHLCFLLHCLFACSPTSICLHLFYSIYLPSLSVYLSFCAYCSFYLFAQLGVALSVGHPLCVPVSVFLNISLFVKMSLSFSQPFLTLPVCVFNLFLSLPLWFVQRVGNLLMSVCLSIYLYLCPSSVGLCLHVSRWFRLSLSEQISPFLSAFLYLSLSFLYRIVCAALPVHL